MREWQHKVGTDQCPTAWALPTETELQRAAATMGYVRTGDFVAEWWNEDRSDDTECHNRFIERLRRRRQRYIAGRETSMLPFWRYVADTVLTENGWSTPSKETYDRFVQMIVEAAIDRLRVEIETRNGNFGVEPTSKAVRSGLAQIECEAAPGERMMELFERYAQQRLAEKRKRTDTIEQDRKIIKLFASFVGETRAVSSITQAEVRDWRDTVAALPPMFASAKAYKGLTLRQTASNAKAAGATGMSPTTVNKYLSTVSPFLSWCVRNAYAGRNPCDGLFYDLQKGKNPRPPFTSDQLKRILASPLFTGFECDGKEHVPGTMLARDWRYWIPLACLFTGARISEIAQLRACDVDEEGGVPFIHIRHSNEDGQRTKSGKSRIAAVHPKLAKLGFLALAAQRLRSGEERLFPELTPNTRGNVGAEASRFWRTYLTRIGLKEPGLGTHSFRHLLADRLRLAGYFNEEIKVALGHSQKSVTSAYGRIPEGTARRLAEMTGQIAFTEVDQLIDAQMGSKNAEFSAHK
jgi:integrase